MLFLKISRNIHLVEWTFTCYGSKTRSQKHGESNFIKIWVTDMTHLWNVQDYKSIERPSLVATR